MDGEAITDFDIWDLFIKNAREANQDYIEIFTTDSKLDSLLHQMGAWHIKEAPIMVRGLDNNTATFCIQPWDRENWTNLSMVEAKE